MKRESIFFIELIAFVGLLCVAGCTKVPAPTLPSARLSGNFVGKEICLLSGNLSDTLRIVATSATQVNIVNLYGLPNAVTGSISNDSCVIQPQLNNNYVVQGLLVLANDTLNLSLVVTSFGREDKCAAFLIRQ